MSKTYILERARVNSWSKRKTFSDNMKSYLVPQLTRSGVLNTGLTKDDEKRLEEELGFVSGTLAKNSKYWESFAIGMVGNSVEIFAEEPYGELQYKILKAHKRVADGYSKLTPSEDYVLYNKEDEAISKNVANRNAFKALSEVNSMTATQMMHAVKMLGLGSNASPEVAELALSTFAKDQPAQFLARWVNNPNKEIEILISEAIQANVLRRDRTVYYYGTDNIGSNIDDTIAYLKNKANSDVRKAIESAIKAKRSI